MIGRLWVCVALLVAVRSGAAPPSDDSLKRENRSLQTVCGKCHNLQLVLDTPMSLEAWHETVQKMIDLGADGTDDQFSDIMDYLHRTMTSMDVNSADAGELGLVLGVPDSIVQRIVARRSARKFTGLADLKSVPGIDAASLDAKSRLLFFQ